MKSLLALYWSLFLASCTLFSQNKFVFKPNLEWQTIEEARKTHPDSVYHLTLEKSKLHTLPTEIFKYKNLQSLSVRGMKLVELPDEISVFEQLTFLDISKNKFESFPEQICNLLKLETIVAHKNSFDYLPYQISNLVHLKHIDLWETPVIDFPQSMESMPALIYIDLQGVNINHERQDEIKKRFPHVKFELDPPCNCFH